MLAAGMLCSIVTSAHDFEVDGIYYNITSKEGKTVEVTYQGDRYDAIEEYSGAVSIPATITYDNQEYSVTCIGNEAFAYCYNLTSVQIPYGVTCIDRWAFKNCYKLTYVSIPNSVTSIGSYAFENCSRIRSAKIPNSVTRIEESTFRSSGLTSITIPNSVTSIGNYAFENCSGLTSITIPNSVTSIGNYAFDDCSGLTSITIPNSVTNISDGAFHNCSKLTSVSIGNGVTYIGFFAFSKCDLLTWVTSYIPADKLFSMGDNVFSDATKTSCTLYVPYGAKQAYSEQDGWNRFKTITEIYDGSQTVVINMKDSGYDGWNGNVIRIKENGIETRYAAVRYIDEYHENCRETYEFKYDPNVNYEFYWNKGNYSNECSFDVIIAGKTVVSATPTDCANFTDGQRLYPSPSNQQITITMTDSYGDGWNGNQIIVKEDGTQIGTATISSGRNHTVTFEYNPSSDYAFYWTRGKYSSECSFDIEIAGEMVYRAVTTDCSNYTNGQLICKNEGSKIIINMKDSYGDGWDGYAITVKKDGVQIGTATISGSSGTQTFAYDPESDYTFYGNSNGTYREEISFDIVIDDITVYTHTYHTYDATPSTLFFTYPAIKYLRVIDNEWQNYDNNKSRLVRRLIYSRTLPNMKWNALYLPFKIPVSILAEHYDVAYFNNMHTYDRDYNGEIDEMDMEVMLLTEGTLHANHPYFIRAKSEDAKELNIELPTDATLYATQENSLTCSSVYNNFELKGIYTQRTATELTDCYAINTSGAWAPIASGSYLNPFRLYLKITSRDGSPVEVASSALQSIRIRLKDDYTTDIDEVEMQTTEATIIYDLSGRRVENPSKGIYIVNGKKVVLK